MEAKVSMFVSQNVYLTAFLVSHDICGLGKIYFPDEKSAVASIEVFWSPRHDSRVKSLIESFAKQPVTVDLLKFNQNRRFILRLIRDKEAEKCKINTI